MAYCMALGCSNNSKRRSHVRPGLTFYRFPKDQQLLKRWLVNLRNPKIPQWLDHCAVCSEHFEPECFGRDLKAELLGGMPKPPLLNDAVPTLFSYNNFKADVKRRVYSEERRKRKEKEEILKDLLGPYYDMKPVTLEKQNLTPESPIEDGEGDEKFSIRSLLPGFARTHDNEATTGHDQIRSSTGNDVSTGHDQTRSSTRNDVSTGHDQTRSDTDVGISTGHDQIRSVNDVDVSTGHDQTRSSTGNDVSTGHDQIRSDTDVGVSTGHDQIRSDTGVGVSTGHDQTRSSTNNYVSTTHDQTRLLIGFGREQCLALLYIHNNNNNGVSTGHDQTRSSTDNDVSTGHDQIRSCTDVGVSTGHGQARTITAKPSTVHKRCKKRKKSKARIRHQENQSHTKEISCQTDENPTTEISCQTNKPCLVSTETQWDEKDFTPDPERVQQDHSYCKRKRTSK